MDTFDLSNLNGFNGFRIPSLNGPFGYAVNSAGDINNDGFADAVITGNQVYVIFGTKALLPPRFDLTTLNGSNGFVVNAAFPNSAFGYTLANLDFNMDGYSDLAIGAYNVSISDVLPEAGQTYVIYGKQRFRPAINAKDLDGEDGFTINGVIPFAQVGFAIASLGDINKDGFPDLGIGAPNANNKAGLNYVLFGNSSRFPAVFNLSELNGNNGFTIVGQLFNERSGNAIAGIGDVNNDKVPDIGIGAVGTSTAGKAYVIFGNEFFPSNFRLNALNGTNGFTINGQGAFGFSISASGDVNMDGIPDFTIGEPVNILAYTILGAKNFASSMSVNYRAPGSSWFATYDRDYGNQFCVRLGYSVSGIENFFDTQENSIVVGDPSHTCSNYPGHFYVMPQNAALSGLIDISKTNFKVIDFIEDSRGTYCLGSAVNSLGDFNGDNITDLIVSDHCPTEGARHSNPGLDSGFVIFGSPFFEIN